MYRRMLIDTGLKVKIAKITNSMESFCENS